MQSSKTIQDRVKSINGILCDTEVKVDSCGSRLSSMVTSSTMVRCIEFINKVRELGFIKVRDRQANKFHILVGKSNRSNNTQPLGNNIQLQPPVTTVSELSVYLTPPKHKAKNPYYLKAQILP